MAKIIDSQAPKSKKFDGKLYRLALANTSEIQTRAAASHLRASGGELVRVVKVGREWCAYVRKAPRKSTRSVDYTRDYSLTGPVY